MKISRWWPALGLTTVAVALTGCGSGGDSSSSVSVRVANATLTHPSIDLLVAGAVATSATASDTVGAYATPGSGSVTLQVNDAGGATALASTVPTLTGGNHYTLLAYESGGAVRTALLSEDYVVPAAGVTTLRIYDAAIEAGKLDVYVTTSACTTANLTALSPTTSFGALTAPQAVSLTQGAGNWNVCVTGASSKTDLRMSLPITLTGATVATVVLTPASGGALLNGSQLNQQGTYSAVRNTNARVRLAAAVTGGAVVSASATSTTSTVTVGTSSVAPAFDFAYTLVPASSSLNVTVANQTVAAPAAKLVAGGDATLLVYGPSTGATASLITDDNRLPTDPTATKLRLINGLTGTVSTATLTANTTPVGIGIPQGTASAYTAVPGSSIAMNLLLTTSASATTSGATPILNANAVYSVLAVGDAASATQLLIR